ncbi:hypothetical protein BH18THE1_BH18THE1_13290 [soil metagenome]
MNCVKCGRKLDSPQEVPLCKECVKADSTIKSSDPGELLELHIKSQKEHGLLPEDFRLSDVGRDVAKKIIHELLALGEPSEVVANTVFGFCYGYLCHQKQQEP